MRVDAHDVEVPTRSGLRMVALVAVVGAAVSVLTPSTEAAPAPALRSDVPSVLDATGER
jgi:hypothetical protein